MLCASLLTLAQKAMYKAHIQPIRKKLSKCRDPDRYNLVELQRARREQALNKGDSDDEDHKMETPDSDGAVFGDALPRDSKRRKVAKGLADPFGGPL